MSPLCRQGSSDFLGSRTLRSTRGQRVMAFWIIVVLGVIVDQVVKAAVRATLSVGESAPFVPGVIELRHVENTGAAFGMGAGAGVAFVVIAAVVLVASLMFVWRKRIPMQLAVSIGLVASGGVGNMVDRVIAGSVTDFLCTTFVSFPVFNVADIMVTCGVAVSLVGYYVWESRTES